MRTVKNDTLSRKPKVVSFFSGAGGMDEGFKAAGFQIYSCMDIETWACDTLRTNHKDALIIGPPEYSGNIKAIQPEKFQSLTGVKPGQIDVFTGGPPCQPFSQAASQRFLKEDDRFKRKGFNDFEKGTLLFDYISYIEYFRPLVFLLENVPGLLTIDGGKQLNSALERLRLAGYLHTEPQIVDAADYGVPQFRSRLIIWGTLVKGVKPEIPTPTHGGGLLKPYNTVSQALQDINDSLPNHIFREHKETSIERYRKLEFGQRDKLGRIDRLDPLKPSKTVIAGGTKGGGRSHLHPFLARTLTVRESARLQTFPDTYIFQGAIARQFTQVGNAVPPLLAEKFARKIGSDIFNLRYESNCEFEKHLIQKKSINKISDILLKESFKRKPEWIYFTHVK